ncbi:fatty acid desaturase [Hydrogenibacillus schlegelii]|uniref:Fatty acid desaturase n=1 Tax=Hydrogenibacillus schlegelii TaxID=1484 RepID=A0A132MGB7_HYDSH|nr:fatty acid desaturase [Hydrogenibacillus schlegelii]KWW96882.1 fatty acid desaturase [Hydrogenibacillus schlegelii]OAR05294.1 fatty acid desaturase [Hydrogenibacillus schlegelii]
MKSFRAQDWAPLLRPYARPDLRYSLWQVTHTGLALVVLFSLAYRAAAFFLPLALAIDGVAALFLVRLFILQHDAGHGSLFPRRWMNEAFGFASGVVTLVPYHSWKWQHARHHATSGNLDKRGVGDILTWTVDEYLRASPWARFKYRVYRNPWVMFFIGPIAVFMIAYRFPLGFGGEKPFIRKTVVLTNLVIAFALGGAALVWGAKALLWVYFPSLYLAGMIGIFLFYVQHQFEDAYWSCDPEWEYVRAAMEGSTYLKLPRPLQWVTGNIGFHHIHHLAPGIPNYRLEKVQKEVPLVRVALTVTLKDALFVAFADLHLFDEATRKLIGFRDVAPRLKKGQAAAKKAKAGAGPNERKAKAHGT